MAESDLDRDYAESWHLLSYVLDEAATEPTLSAARRRFAKDCTPSSVLMAKPKKQPHRLGMELDDSARSLTPLDAFAAWRGDPHPGLLRRIDDIGPYAVLGPACLRFRDWVRDWQRCSSDAQYGKQAVITALLIRDDESIATRVRDHLEMLSRRRVYKGDRVHAYALRIGALYFDHDPELDELQDIERGLFGSNE